MSAPKRQRPDEQPARRGLSLLVGEPWSVTLRAGARQLTGTLRTTEDPRTKALSLHMDLSEDQGAVWAPPPAAGSPLAGAPALPRAEERLRRATGPPPAAAAPAAARHPSGSPLSGARTHRELDLRRMKCNGPTHTKKDRTAALRDALGVTRLVGVMCESDPETDIWSRQLLQLAAPTVEELSLHGARDAHLHALYTMPRLRRLEMHVTDDPNPPASALPPGHAGLQWLSVSGLRRATLQSLLQAHGRSLLELQLWVGTALPSSDVWPHSCSDLHSLLDQCDPEALRKLVLQRQGCAHDLLHCGMQVKDVFEALLGAVSVRCSRCDGVEVECL